MNLIRVSPNEMLFIRRNAPHGMLRTLANNIKMEYSKVRAEFFVNKDEYPEELVIEARRLLEANTGKVYNPNEVAA